MFKHLLQNLSREDTSVCNEIELSEKQLNLNFQAYLSRFRKIVYTEDGESRTNIY